MPISVRVCKPDEVAFLRERYRDEMHCQIVHDSIHARPGWSREYILEMNGVAAAYGSVAIGGPWKNSPALYEFYVNQEHRRHVFDLFTALRASCGAGVIETQTNSLFLPVMLHTFGQNISAGAILFEDRFETRFQPEGAEFRPAVADDVELLTASELDDTAGWVVTSNGCIAGAGGVLYHYNRPYGDVYMKIAEPFRNRGLGSYLVQELKRVCRLGAGVPAARCNIGNLASRRTLQKAGFVPCGNLITGELAPNQPREV